jgi:hypothetical protein
MEPWTVQANKPFAAGLLADRGFFGLTLIALGVPTKRLPSHSYHLIRDKDSRK